MQNERRRFTDKYLRSLKPRDKIFEVFDAIPGFGARVSPKGRVTFFLLARFGNAKHPTRRRITVYSPLIDGSLAKARETALRWQAELARGVDPVAAIAAERRENLKRQRHTFKAVCEDFIEKHLPGRRSRAVMEAILRKKFMPDNVWGARGITEITQDDIITEIQKIVDSGHRAYAHNVFSVLRKLFNWAAARPMYGLDRRSPCDKFDLRGLVGSKTRRSRKLTDIELRAFWRATERLGYPYGHLYRLLALTLQRKSEIGQSRLGEYDFEQRLLKIPGERMKAGIEHIVPLTEQAIAILKSLPEFTGGDYLFSNDGGVSPCASYSMAKQRLDRLMEEELRNIAVETGGDPDKTKLEPFVVHDLRRTGRSGLSALRIADEVKERVLAHLAPGIRAVYDWHDYLPEKREALDAWARRLEAIVNPMPPNVVALRA